MRKIICMFFVIFPISSQSITISAGPEDNIYIAKAVPMIKSIYKKLGYNIDIKHSSFERSLLEASSGRSDGELFRFNKIIQSYPTLIKVDEPLFYIRTIAYSSKKHIIINNWEDMRPFKIAIVRGVKLIENATKGMDVIKTNTHKEAFTLLKKGRINLVISGELTAKKHIEELKMKNIILSRHILDSRPVFHVVHQNQSSLVPKLEELIRDINRNN